MSPAEQNYQIYDKEMLAVHEALQEWRQYLLSAVSPTEVWSDHLNLTYYRKPQNLSKRQARWISDLADYNFTIHHLPGKLNNKADALSRRPDYVPSNADNQGIIGLPDSLFCTLDLFSTDRRTTIAESTNPTSDPIICSGLESHPEEWRASLEGFYSFRGKVYIPDVPSLCHKILADYHDTPIAGHPGKTRMWENIERFYWWPTIEKDVADYVKGCPTCQHIKSLRSAKAAPLVPNEIPSYPWEIISWDLIGPLPPSNGFNAILVIVDRFTKLTHVIPTHTNLTAEGSARLLRDHVFHLHGLPKKIISDRGPQFVSRFMKEFYRLVRIEGAPSTAFHPQTNGQTERVNQEIEQYLHLFINYHQSDWAEWLSITEFSLNDKVSSSTGYTPFFLNYGQHPRTGWEIIDKSHNQRAEDFTHSLKQA